MRTEIEKLFDEKPSKFTEEHFALFARFKQALNEGTIRSAEPDAKSAAGWRVNIWVKKGILLGLRMGTVVDMSPDPVRLPMFDKATFPVKRLGPESGIRMVPGGSSIRDGSFIGKGVICMPPMYINAGVYIGESTMVDSHALVGSCAQVGKNCHISAAAQIGGVIEPVGALPVIIEDDVLVGGNCGIYEGAVVKRRAVLGSGVILTRSTPVYDIARGEVYRATDDEPLVIPEDAVVVAGSRAIARGPGKDWGLSLYTPVIVKYRDSKTDARVQLEDLLR
jgi:2,3,4,5-tetrahydropyridine-2-carboxylate N-succinyltransferase